MSVRERIKLYIEFKEISQRRFEVESGLSNGYVNNISNSISHKKIEGISKAFPDLNVSWLLLGEGEMIKQDILEDDEVAIINFPLIFARMIEFSVRRKNLDEALVDLKRSSPFFIQLVKRMFYLPRKFTNNYIDAFTSSYPEVNREWLITGKGVMTKTSLLLGEYKNDGNRDTHENNLNHRIVLLLEHFSMSKQEFNEVTRIGLEKIEKICDNLIEPSNESLSLILKFFPDLNPDWLLNGFGEMFISLKENPGSIHMETGKDLEMISFKDGVQFRQLDKEKFLIITPLIRDSSDSQYFTKWSDPDYVNSLSKHAIVIESFSMDTFRSFEISGDRMDDGTKESICDGDIVTGKRIDPKNWIRKMPLLSGRFFIMNLKFGLIPGKLKSINLENGSFGFYQFNTDKETNSEIEITFGDINEIYHIISVNQSRFHN